MKLSINEIKDILVSPGFITEAQLNEAAGYAESEKKEIVYILIEMGLIKDEELGKLIAQKRGWNFKNLRQLKIEKKLFRMIPESVSTANGFLIFEENEENISVGMLDPENELLKHLIEKKFKKSVKSFFITENDFHLALSYFRYDLKEKILEMLDELEKDQTIEKREKILSGCFNSILELGFYNKASDIHIEPQARNLLIRMRIDGELVKIFDLNINLAEFFINRLKILSGMKIDEHSAAQDGRIELFINRQKIDFRASVIPSIHGEKAVIRILSATSRKIGFNDLGLSEKNSSIIKRSIQNTRGIILVVGPTANGKTTTLYEIIKLLNNSRVNITTIEDPVEYDLEGITQIQVNLKKNITYASGLKAIVRQDPDIIMIGEIRDSETAKMAINAAMIGHMVLSTMHATDSATVITRLMEMGVEPFFIMSTLQLVIAQRLARKICFYCKHSYNPDKNLLAFIEMNPDLKNILTRKNPNLGELTLYKGAGCKFCDQTGMKDRTGIFEIMEIDENIRSLIINNYNKNKVLEQTKQNGMKTLLENGVDKLLNGEIDLMELMRVLKN